MSDDPSLREDINKALEQAAQAETARQRAEPTFTRGQSAPAAVRFFVTKIAVGVWAIYIGVFGLFIIFGGEHATADRTSLLFEVLKVAILPILTFAIGHYFGSKSE